VYPTDVSHQNLAVALVVTRDVSPVIRKFRVAPLSNGASVWKMLISPSHTKAGSRAESGTVEDPRLSPAATGCCPSPPDNSSSPPRCRVLSPDLGQSMNCPGTGDSYARPCAAAAERLKSRLPARAGRRPASRRPTCPHRTPIASCQRSSRTEELSPPPWACSARAGPICWRCHHIPTAPSPRRPRHPTGIAAEHTYKSKT